MLLIDNLQITNFKCFKQLDVKDLGQVNLIGGKNNVGKTAFLEAVELLLSSKNAENLTYMLHNLLEKRQSEIKYFELDFFYKDQKDMKISSGLDNYREIKWVSKGIDNNQKNDSIIYVGIPTDKLILSVFDEPFSSEREITIHDLIFLKSINRDLILGMRQLNEEQRFTYISPAKFKEQHIAILLGKLIDFDREDFLNNSLALFDNNIKAIKQVFTQQGVVLKLKLKNQENLVLLSSLGEGVNRFISILCAIWANKFGFLLIDEIENGIHYTNYKKLWEIIFKTSVEANCQLFITTHSKECISAFNDMQFETENCKAQYFEFYKNLKTDLIVASSRDKEQLRYALTHEGRVRGE